MTDMKMAHSYERVRYTPDGGLPPKNVILRDVRQTTVFLTGIEVNFEGDEIAPFGVDERRHVIALSAVKRRTPMDFDLKYGMLVPRK